MGRLLGVLLWVITLVTVYLFSGRMGWFPEPVSDVAPAIDQQFMRTLAVVATAFVLAQVTLGYFVWRYRATRRGPAVYTHGSAKLEAALMALTTVVFVTLAVLGQRVWAQLHLQQVPADALQIEVTSQQFAWNFRYPGPDGKFGRTSPKLINDQDNPVGTDPSDPASADDVVSVNRLAVPLNRTVQLTLRSKDVTHSFFVPVLRIKQDTVPGMAIPFHFKAVKPGEYEIACAELCGLAHYKMKGYLMVLPDEAFAQWLKERSVR